MATNIPATEVNIDGGSENGNIDFANLLPQILEKFIAVLEGAAIIAIGFFLIKYVRKYLHSIEVKHQEQRTALNLLEKITSGFLVVISITVALKVVGIDISLIVSVLILGLSYGLQDIIKNYVAGILILFKAPFKIGEIVKIRDHTGRVQKMDFQATTLETFDHRNVTIYNSDVMTQSIINFSNNTVRRIEIDVMLGYGSDTPTALQIFRKILDSHPSVLKSPTSSIVFKKFADNAVVFTIKFWVQYPANVLKIRSEIALMINEAFDEQKIFMPFSKGVEAENDYTLVDTRKNRIQSFYQLPLFAESALPPEQQLVTVDLDAEEPE